MLFPKQNRAALGSPGLTEPTGYFLHQWRLCLQHIPLRTESENQTESLAFTKMQKLSYLWLGSPVSLGGTSPRSPWEFPSSFSQGECLEQPFSMENPKEFPVPLLRSLGHEPGFKENIEHGRPVNPAPPPACSLRGYFLRGKYRRSQFSEQGLCSQESQLMRKPQNEFPPPI